MEISRRSFVLSAGAATLCSALGGWSTSVFAQTATPVKGGTIRVFLNQPTVLVSAVSSAGQTALISPKIFDGLVEYDQNMAPHPRMATSVAMSEDAKTLTIVLREGLKWHDGQPITSADVAFSALEVWKKFHSRGRSTYAALERVDTPDALTSVFHFSRPSAFVMNALFAAEAQVVPSHIYQGTDILKNPANTAPVGSGPYRFVEWKQGEYILLEKNPDYWAKDEPYADQIVALLVQDSSARAVAFEAQEVDAAGGIPVSMADARRLAALPYIEIPETGYEAFGNNNFVEVNLRRPYLQDVRVRRALLHALDRDFMLKNVYFGFGTAATGPVPATMKTFYTADVPTYGFDPQQAKALLDEAGFKPDSRGKRLSLTIDPLPSGDLYSAAAAYMKQAFAVIGVELNIRSGDIATYYRRIYSDYDFDLTFAGASALTDPTIGVQRFFWSKNIIPGVPFSNGSGYANAEMDAILEAAAAEPNPQKRVALFHRFQALAATDLPILPIADVPYFAVKNKRLKNTENSPFGFGGSFSTAYIDG
ncbi:MULTISPECIES: ABC transporter substrate-binding protein [unclassified Brenneria]|uniref:ABC transporter substrate-binding protein n=1 Tax=unclassified Brenneria TaxID=2634434 RepID=UPI0029C40C4D|nr:MULTISPECIES: ABC transporter substrate-binding protein [unclassified Brenneria]MDX5627461.1 ABC transporter substrate-binding protein [Brenneria sp. L3-3Z]MDX5694383.1 ABC transporter substrate-binding protein [Brenneria sp. L4-2C]